MEEVVRFWCRWVRASDAERIEMLIGIAKKIDKYRHIENTEERLEAIALLLKTYFEDLLEAVNKCR